jgi:type IV pilus assembly protein PilA
MESLRSGGARPGEAGFTLPELLVVMMIVGILASIAVPSFADMRGRAQDAEAKSALRTASMAAESLALENDGAYAGALKVTRRSLEQMEPTLADVQLTVRAATVDSYTLRIRSESGSRFELSRASDGTVSTWCRPKQTGGCPKSGAWD